MIYGNSYYFNMPTIYRLCIVYEQKGSKFEAQWSDKEECLNSVDSSICFVRAAAVGADKTKEKAGYLEHSFEKK